MQPISCWKRLLQECKSSRQPLTSSAVVFFSMLIQYKPKANHLFLQPKPFFMRWMLPVFFLFSVRIAMAQAKLVLNGAVITISGGAALVIDNPDNTAIIQTGSGYIQSEGAMNRVIWTVGTGNGSNYLVPFGNAANYLPLRFSAASGSGASGQIVFSTYPTPTWKNSDFL